MKREHEQALAAVRAAMNEVLANFPENREVYILDAVDSYLSKTGLARLCVDEIEEQIDDEELELGTVAVLDDGTVIMCDLEEGRVWIEE